MAIANQSLAQAAIDAITSGHALAPASCTSMEWQKIWPIKPDIVMEAGNMANNPAFVEADYIDDALQLLSTGHRFVLGKQLVSFGDTSAAAALAANLAAKVQALYPDYWPETIRALLIHSARWIPAMKAVFEPLDRQDKYRYASHGLRFHVRRPLESLTEFKQRINQQPG